MQNHEGDSKGGWLEKYGEPLDIAATLPNEESADAAAAAEKESRATPTEAGGPTDESVRKANEAYGGKVPYWLADNRGDDETAQ